MPKRGPVVSDAKTKAQQDAALNMRALRMLREAETAVKRKQNDVARNYCHQIIALAPESPSARSAKQMLSRLDIPR
jgi:TolA-binding protein